MRTCAALLLALAAACRPEEKQMSVEEVMDPEACKECHPRHHEEWLASMHAYAAEDPVFRAMNALGQEQTDGELGSFCVQCHAPVAVALGLTEDGLNLDDVPAHLRGVTCYACHDVVDVDGDHNNPLTLGMDAVMRGGIEDPQTDLAPHEAEWSRWLAGSERETLYDSARMCGSCHDIVTPAGVHLERTYAEWQASLFADVDVGGVLPEPFAQGCVGCHMGPPEPGPIADAEGVRGDRHFHPHDFAGVDLHLSDFPDQEQGPAIAERARDAVDAGPRRAALCSTLCIEPADGGGYSIHQWLHNETAGHSWPSGATQDRRAWVELVAFDGDDRVLESGVVPDDVPIVDLDDPNLWLIRDRMLDAQGQEVHMFWEARSVEGELLEMAEELTPFGDASTWRMRTYHVDSAVVDRVTSRVRIRPVGLDVMDALVDAGVLDPVFRDRIGTYDMPSSVLEWTPEAGDAFCAQDIVDCGEWGSCVGARVGEAFASCLPLELRAQ
jgi:hypothetical protein